MALWMLWEVPLPATSWAISLRNTEKKNTSIKDTIITGARMEGAAGEEAGSGDLSSGSDLFPSMYSRISILGAQACFLNNGFMIQVAMLV